MVKKWILHMLILLLCLPLAYCQELASDELKTFYDAMEFQIRSLSSGNSDSSAQDFADQRGLDEEELSDIMVAGYRMPLSATEEKVADELKKRLSCPRGEKMMSADDMRVMEELANKYGMSFGQVCSVFIRMNSDLL